jgi:hypothetical protein
MEHANSSNLIRVVSLFWNCSLHMIKVLFCNSCFLISIHGSIINMFHSFSLNKAWDWKFRYIYLKNYICLLCTDIGLIYKSFSFRTSVMASPIVRTLSSLIFQRVISRSTNPPSVQSVRLHFLVTNERSAFSFPEALPRVGSLWRLQYLLLWFVLWSLICTSTAVVGKFQSVLSCLQLR